MIVRIFLIKMNKFSTFKKQLICVILIKKKKLYLIITLKLNTIQIFLLTIRILTLLYF